MNDCPSACASLHIFASVAPRATGAGVVPPVTGALVVAVAAGRGACRRQAFEESGTASHFLEISHAPDVFVFGC
jgi:hypothetical protein